MIILGIDPGTARVGWAVINAEKGNIRAVSYGCIETEKSETPGDRLVTIHNALMTILKKYKPMTVSVEELFFATNAKTAISVGQARGVILLVAAQCGVSVVSYSPPSIKLAICGNGNAEKTQVQRMVTKLLHLAEIPKPDDTADALAIALTHAYSYKVKSKLI